MISDKRTRKDAGAKEQKPITVPVILPDETIAYLQSTVRLRKRLRKKRKKVTPPAENA